MAKRILTLKSSATKFLRKNKLTRQNGFPQSSQKFTPWSTGKKNQDWKRDDSTTDYQPTSVIPSRSKNLNGWCMTINTTNCILSCYQSGFRSLYSVRRLLRCSKLGIVGSWILIAVVFLVLKKVAKRANDVNSDKLRQTKRNDGRFDVFLENAMIPQLTIDQYCSNPKSWLKLSPVAKLV